MSHSRVAILGTGAVGVFLGARLAGAGCTPQFIARSGDRRQEEWQLVDVRLREERLRVEVLSAPEGPLDVAHLLLCVRGEQLDSAIATAVRFAPAAALGIGAPVSPAEFADLRTRHAGHVLYTLTPMFNAWSESEHRYRWMQPPLVKTLLSGEDDAAGDVAAREMAGLLRRGGLRVRVVPSATRATATFFAAGLPVLAAWELSGWTANLIEGAALRRTTARAMREALLVTRDARDVAASVLRVMPPLLLSTLLATTRCFVTKHLLAMWQHHGPKIEAQTRNMLDAMLARGARDGIATPELTRLREALSDVPRKEER